MVGFTCEAVQSWTCDYWEFFDCWLGVTASHRVWFPYLLVISICKYPSYLSSVFQAVSFIYFFTWILLTCLPSTRPLNWCIPHLCTDRLPNPGLITAVSALLKYSCGSFLPQLTTESPLCASCTRNVCLSLFVSSVWLLFLPFHSHTILLANEFLCFLSFVLCLCSYGLRLIVSYPVTLIHSI